MSESGTPVFTMALRSSSLALPFLALTLAGCGDSGTTYAYTPPGTEAEAEMEAPPPIIGTDAFGQEFTGNDGSYDGFRVRPRTVGGKEYFVQTNPWRTGTEQTVLLDHNWLFMIEALSNTTALQVWDVITFPSIFLGTSHAGDTTQGSGLPLAYSELTSVPTGFSTNADQIEYRGNAAYDTYWTASSTYDGGAPDTYLMVWLWGNGLNPITDAGYTCNDQPPTHVGSCTELGTLQVGGLTFHRFYGLNHEGKPVISYAVESRIAALEFDLLTFAQDAVSQGLLDPSYYLQSVQGGLEIISGGIGLGANGFYVSVNP